MLNYIKYELRGSYRFMLGILLVMMLAFMGIHYFIKSNIGAIITLSEDALFTAGEIGIVVFGMIIFGAFLTAIIYIVGLFRKELYEDRGYLTFTLPMTGSQIIGAKLIVAITWLAVILLSTLVFNVLSISLFYRESAIIGRIVSVLREFTVLEILVTLFRIILLSVTSFLTAYLAISISKVSIRRKKLGGLWFIIYLLIDGGSYYLTSMATRLAPYAISLRDMSIIDSSKAHYSLASTYNKGYELGAEQTSSEAEKLANSIKDLYDISNINILGMLVIILIAILVFKGTSYILENKIDM